ncbi:hypothetical protein CQ10_34665 [Bradyrhizobium valentinum]|uniref:Uncharacterized protein n=1 Tax=Bradyrhizobium valentinum TaxID=1518501 RepID=A0A0R3KIH3_9BRAD|nr:hypothetical protein CP49_37275 [Bradyrhizobium valentinum]KRQ93999.1 hypothetical protein CQ10_34665 [Bradyrhizobium valentinum]
MGVVMPRGMAEPKRSDAALRTALPSRPGAGQARMIINLSIRINAVRDSREFRFQRSRSLR